MNRRRNNNNNRRRNRRQVIVSPNRFLSTRDWDVQTRKLRFFSSVKLTQETGTYWFHVENLNVALNGDFTKPFFTLMRSLYDQYAVTNIRIRAVPGKGMDANNRMKINLFSRADVSYNRLPNTIAGAQEMLFSNNVREVNFGQRTVVPIIDVKPLIKQTAGSTANQALLNNNMQWYNTSDLNNATLENVWNVGNLLMITHKEGEVSVPEIRVGLNWEVTCRFRSRRVHLDSSGLVIPPSRSFSNAILSNNISG